MKPDSTARLEARLPNEVLVRLKRAAEIQGRSLTDFVVSAADEAARRAIEQTEILRFFRRGPASNRRSYPQSSGTGAGSKKSRRAPP